MLEGFNRSKRMEHLGQPRRSAGTLASAGEDEHFYLAKRMKTRLPNLLDHTYTAAQFKVFNHFNNKNIHKNN